jgi:hypothetical protein
MDNLHYDLLEEQHFISPNFEMWIEDGILFATVLTDTFTLEVAEESVEQRIKITQGKPFPCSLIAEK